MKARTSSSLGLVVALLVVALGLPARPAAGQAIVNDPPHTV